MGTRFVYKIAKALEESGYQAIRFNFRGVGRSEGEYDYGHGEMDDALAMWDHFLPNYIVGFSFGGAVALQVAAVRDAKGLMCISAPAKVRDSDLEPWRMATDVHCPAVFIHGDEDDVVPIDQMEALAAPMPTPPVWLKVPGADHFLTPTHLDEGVEAVLAGMKVLNGESAST